MATDYLDRWELNGTEVLIRDKGRGQANGVAVLNAFSELPNDMLNNAIASTMKVSPEAPSDLNFQQWVEALGSSAFKNRGQEWTKGTYVGSSSTDITNKSIKYLAYADGKWLACTEANYGCYYSTDGKVWRQSLGNNTNYSMHQPYYLNGLWLCGSNAHGIWWSSTGTAWTQGTGFSGTISFYDVVYANNVFVATSSNGLWWSENGKAWTKVPDVDLGISIATHSLLYANGLWVLGSSGQGMWWSEDGKNWTQEAESPTYSASKVWFINGLWFSAGPSVGCKWSEDGKVWHDTSALSTLLVNDITFGNNVFVSTTSKSTWYSYDGKSWTQSSAGNQPDSETRALVFFKGIFIISYTAFYGMWWSSDGITWTAISGSQLVHNAFVMSYGILLAYGNNKEILQSTDGKQWTEFAIETNTTNILCHKGFLVRTVPSQGCWWSGTDVWLPDD